MCGRINAFQRGTTDGFQNSVVGLNPGVEGPYLDGVSLTHGAAGSRQHIWTLVVALQEHNPASDPQYFCPCSDTNSNWPYQIPSFIRNNYFSDTDNPGPGFLHAQVYTWMILCGMVRGAANSTTLLGSAQHCHNPLLMTSS